MPSFSIPFAPSGPTSSAYLIIKRLGSSDLGYLNSYLGLKVSPSSFDVKSLICLMLLASERIKVW